jgi:predicted nucleic acid-binding protein
MRYMLDTNICIAIMKKISPRLRTRLEALLLEHIGVSSIVIAELCFYVESTHHCIISVISVFIYTRGILV